MKIQFRIGTVFPPGNPVARFVCGVAIAMNDLTLTNEHAASEFARTDGGRNGISLHNLYRLCAHYREAAKFLDDALDDPRVSGFVGTLSTEAQADLAVLQASYSPWHGSFVESKLKPVRDAVFHYMDWTKSDLTDAMATAANVDSGIELGRGTYAENRYEFADEIVRAHAAKPWGSTEKEITRVLRQLTELVLAFTRFGHVAVTAYLKSSPQGGSELSDQDPAPLRG